MFSDRSEHAGTNGRCGALLAPIERGWASTARILVELIDAPVLVLDAQLVIRLANKPAIALLGGDRGSAEGRGYIDAFVPAALASHAARSIAHATAVLQSGVEIPLAVPDGRLLLLSVDFMSAAEGQSCLVVRAWREGAAPSSSPVPDVAFEVSIAGGSWGVITRVLGPSPALSILHVGSRCYEAAGHDHPPHDCPILRSAKPHKDSLVATTSCFPGHILVASVRQSEADKVTVSGRLVDIGVLGVLADARIEALVERGKLSERERQVLTQLVKSGDSIGVIAERLKIRPATVKFHTANLLQKLGADSRIDLFRLLF